MLMRKLIPLVLLLAALAGCSQEPAASTPGGNTMTGVTGTVTTPLEGAYLCIYRKGTDLYGPAFAVSEPTGAVVPGG